MENNQQNRFPVESSLLEFDRGNPRLVAEKNLKGASDEEVIAALVNTADIGELVNSIVANLYMDIEPLIVTKKNVTNKENYRVLEGNRRLAAIRLLQNPDLAKSCDLSIPSEIAEEVLASMEFVTVYLVKDELESRAFIGFKHVNGAHRWDSYAKARFLTDWYIAEMDNGITVEDIARQLGDRNQTVRNLISGMSVLKQAEDKELFDIGDRSKRGPFGFSHLYTALNRVEYRKFLELPKDWNQKPVLNPISENREEALQEVLYYIYGSKKDDIQSVIKSQNPNLKQLGKVLINEVALSILRQTNKLEKAVEEIQPPNIVFNESLIKAHLSVKDSLNKTGKYSPLDGDKFLPLAEEMSINSVTILDAMKKKLKRIV